MQLQSQLTALFLRQKINEQWLTLRRCSSRHSQPSQHWIKHTQRVSLLFLLNFWATTFTVCGAARHCTFYLWRPPHSPIWLCEIQTGKFAITSLPVHLTVSPAAERLRYILGDDEETMPTPTLFTEMDTLQHEGDELEWRESARYKSIHTKASQMASVVLQLVEIQNRFNKKRMYFCSIKILCLMCSRNCLTVNHLSDSPVALGHI